MSTSNTDTGDTVNITTTEVTTQQHSMDNSNGMTAAAGSEGLQMTKDEPAPREALVNDHFLIEFGYNLV